jgi:hypothetical protein
MSLKIIENSKRINFENEDLRREQDKLILNRIDGTFNIFKVKISISIDLNENKVYELFFHRYYRDSTDSIRK